MRSSTILVSLAALASSATAIQLSSIAALPSGFNGSPGCVSAYEAQITQCTSLDLKSSCSEGCTKALNTAASNIILACRQASIPSSATVLKAAMSGGDSLASAVCGSSGSGDDEEEEEEKPASSTTKTASIGKSTSAAGEVTSTQAGIIKDDTPTPTPVASSDEAASSASKSAAAASKTGSSDDSTNGGDVFSPGSGDAKDNAAGGLRVMVGLAVGVVVGAVGLVW